MRWSQSDLVAYQARRGKIPSGPSDSVELESKLHSQIIEHLRSKGWLYFHGRMDHPSYRTGGEPDFTILAPGKVVFVEAKAQKKKPSDTQQIVHCWASKLGHTIYTVWNFEQYLEALRSSGISP